MSELGTLEPDLEYNTLCCLCGDDILGDDTDSGSEQIFTECPEWSNSMKQNGHVYGKPDDLDDVYFQIPWIWSRVYRAIFQTYRGDHRELHLSGVGLYSSWSEIPTLPRDENELIFGDPWKTPDKLIEANNSALDYDRKDVNPCAYALHERCWVLMTRILDVNLIKTHLDLFVKTVCQMKKDWRIYSLDHKLNEDWDVNRMRKWTKLKRMAGKKFMQKREKIVASVGKRIECSDKRYAFRDPLKVLEVRNLIKQAERSSSLNSVPDVRTPGPSASFKTHPNLRETMASKKKLETSDSRRLLTVLRSSSTFDAKRIILPLEIILLIMDRLLDSEDIRIQLWVFPHWRPAIPQSYWRTRFVEDLMLDYKEVPELDALDWRPLFFKTKHIFPVSHGLRNRRRIMKVLEKVKALFLEYVADEASEKELETI